MNHSLETFRPAWGIGPSSSAGPRPHPRQERRHDFPPPPPARGSLPASSASSPPCPSVCRPRPAPADDVQIPAPGETQAGPYKVTGPYTHANLSIYLIRGADRLSGKHYLTLQEAMDKKIIKIYETGDVNQLAIENASADQEVYIQSGDIVKGGRQDRTLVDGFRLRAGGEDADRRLLRRARPLEPARRRAGGGVRQFQQRAVQQVAEGGRQAGAGPGRSLEAGGRAADEGQPERGASVNAAESSSSLQLSLENKNLQDTTEAYVKALPTRPTSPTRSATPSRSTGR